MNIKLDDFITGAIPGSAPLVCCRYGMAQTVLLTLSRLRATLATTNTLTEHYPIPRVLDINRDFGSISDFDFSFDVILI